MKKMTLRKLFGGLCCAAMVMFAASCAQGVDDETWTSGVSGVQLESPAADAIAFSLATDASGNEQVKVVWPVSMGAGGYEVTVYNVNDVDNPEIVVDHEVVDGCSLLFPLSEDTNYEVSVLTLGNEKYNNTGATSATTVPFSTMIGGQTIPAGTEIGKYITDWMTSHLDEYKANLASDPNFEFAFDLERGAAYTLEVSADFGPIPVRLRGTQGNRPVVTVGENAALRPSNGLKIKNVNFDCKKMEGSAGARGLISMMIDPDESLAQGQAYYCDKPIRIESCWVKELPVSLFNIDECAWGINELRISDCIVQLNNRLDNAWKTILCAHSGTGRYGGANGAKWYGGIANTMVLNSTIYNIWPSDTLKDSAYFIRFSNQDISKWYGSYNGCFDIKNSTLVRCVPRKDFGNNIANKPQYVITFENSNFWDCYRLQKVKRGGTYVWKNNTIWGVFNSVDSTDKKEIATEENMGFTDENIFKVLDFSQPNGGVNFTATGSISSTIGDPRWLN